MTGGCKDLFGNWEEQAERYRDQDLNPSRDYKTRMDRRRARYEEYLSRNPNPMVREWLEQQLGHMK